MSYIDTFDRRTMDDNYAFPVSSAVIECETCIVGGGLAGITTALQLLRAGQAVVVREAESIGWALRTTSAASNSLRHTP